jgi:transposase
VDTNRKPDVTASQAPVEEKPDNYLDVGPENFSGPKLDQSWSEGGLMGRKTKRQYTLEFKQQAAELALQIGLTRAAEQLGVNVANVKRWVGSTKNADAGEAKKTKAGLEAENRRLQREVDELRKVNHILKRAAAFFSQDHLK